MVPFLQEEEKWTMQSPETGQDCYRRQDTTRTKNSFFK